MKITSSLFAALALSAVASTASADIIRLGFATEPYPPFATPDATGQVTGWEVDIANAVCAEARLECEIVTTSWDGIIPALVAEKLDVIAASLSINEERQKVIDFSDKYYQTGAALVAAKGSGIAPTPEGVTGKTIGVQSGSVHQAYALKHFPNANIREYQTQDEANQDVFSGRLDGTLADVMVLDGFLTSDEGALCCENVGLVANDESVLGLGIGFGLRKGNDALLEKLNTAIAAIRANGTYDAITAKYFDFNIYGE